jgi:hypothetical protein
MSIVDPSKEEKPHEKPTIGFKIGGKGTASSS